MRVSKLIAASLFVPVMMMSTMLPAESKNPSDYPLRLQIFGHSQTTFYWRRVTDEAKGDGRADLYENGEAHGVDFNYDCGYKVRSSFGYETYPARWKKPGRELVVLLPVFGQSGKFFTCDFNTDVKDFTYVRTGDGLRSEPVAQFKEWMQRHDFDPEHGKDVPVRGNASAEAPSMPPPPAGASAPQP
jgi:hypothetical protein